MQRSNWNCHVRETLFDEKYKSYLRGDGRQSATGGTSGEFREEHVPNYRELTTAGEGEEEGWMEYPQSFVESVESDIPPMKKKS